MYCRNCGKEIQDEKELCAACETKLNGASEENVVEPEVISKPEEIEVVKDVKNENTENTTQQKTVNANDNVQPKSKVVAGLFGILLGAFGVHNFYLGYTGKAIAQLLISVLSCGALSFVSAIWGVIEGILILAGNTITKDADGVDLVS